MRIAAPEPPPITGKGKELEVVHQLQYLVSSTVHHIGLVVSRYRDQQTHWQSFVYLLLTIQEGLEQ
jgi:hypothetical protein